MPDTYDMPTREPLLLALPRPLTYKGGRIDELRLVEPTAGQVHTAELTLNKTGAQTRRLYQAKLLSIVSGVDLDALSGIGIHAFTAASQYLQGFVMEGLPDDDNEGRARGPDDTLTISFLTPLTVNGITYSEIVVSEPTLDAMQKAESHLKGMEPAAVRQYQISLVERATGVHALLARSLPISALNRAAVFAQGFSAAGPEIGQSSSAP